MVHRHAIQPGRGAARCRQSLAPDRRDLLTGLQRYVDGVGPSASGAEIEHMLGILRWLESRLELHRIARLYAAAAGAPALSPPFSLGTFARHVAAWLREHPERANEPLEWLVQGLLDHMTPYPNV